MRAPSGRAKLSDSGLGLVVSDSSGGTGGLKNLGGAVLDTGDVAQGDQPPVPAADRRAGHVLDAGEGGAGVGPVEDGPIALTVEEPLHPLGEGH